MTEDRTFYYKITVENQKPRLDTVNVIVRETIYKMSRLDQEPGHIAMLQIGDNSPPPDSGYMSIRDARFECGLSKSYLRELCRLGKVDAVKANGIWLVRRDSLASHMTERIRAFAYGIEQSSRFISGAQANELAIDHTKLLYVLVESFNITELKNLFFELNVDYEIMDGDNKMDKARELILYLKRHNRLGELIVIIQRYRPLLDLL